MNINLENSYCLVPANLNELPSLAATPMFIAPNTIDLRDYCTPTDNQFTKPYCAGFTAANLAENILWRKNDFPYQIDAEKIYNYAKTIDNFQGDGTTLVAVAKALIDLKIIDAQEADIKVIGKSINDIKYSIHKYGCLMTAFNVSEDWFNLNPLKHIIDTIEKPGAYGHAMLACGYTKEYLILQNSWGTTWGKYGFAFINWNVVQQQFLYGCNIINCLKNI